MQRFSVFCLLVVASMTLTAGVAPAAAQENATATPTPDPGPQLEIDAGADTDAERYVKEIDSSLRIMEWSYDRDREGFVLVFEADESTRITITEAVQFEEGAGDGRIYSNRIPEGVSEVFVPVQLRARQAAVTMTTHETLEQNRYAYVSTGQVQPDRPAIPYERVRLLIALTAIGVGAFTFRTVRNRQESVDEEVKRVL